MIELSIINLFISNKEIFLQYYKYLNIEYIKSNYKDIYKIIKTIESYYNKYQSNNISIENLEAHYINSFPVIKDSDRKLLSSLLQRISEADVSGTVIDYLETHKQRSLAGQIALTAFDVSEGKKPFSSLLDLYEQYSQKPEEEKNIYETDNLEELYDTQLHERGLRWRLHFLNRSLGSLRKGDFGFVFARPETGKTTFLASEVTNFAEQVDRPILWCNNEEGGAKVKLRCIQATLGITNSEMFSNRGKYGEAFRSQVGERLKIYSEAGMTMRDIEARCKELNPSMIILDQIDKIKGGPKDERYDLQMKLIYQWARELAKKYGPTIGICQAGGSAEGKRWLTMNDVDSSHTAKQGEADFIIGIGKTNDEGLQNMRYLNISKNKLIGDEDTDSSMRHGRAEVLIKAEIARYEDL